MIKFTFQNLERSLEVTVDEWLSLSSELKKEAMLILEETTPEDLMEILKHYESPQI